MKGRSSDINLLEFTTHVFRGFLARARTDVIYTDFSKAFDRVDHGILLLKLSLIGIPDISHRWLASYLSLRTQRVLFGYYWFCRVTIWVPYCFYCFLMIFLMIILIVLFWCMLMMLNFFILSMMTMVRLFVSVLLICL